MPKMATKTRADVNERLTLVRSDVISGRMTMRLRTKHGQTLTARAANAEDACIREFKIMTELCKNMRGHPDERFFVMPRSLGIFDGVAFLVSPLVATEPVSARLERGAMAADLVLRTAACVCRAIRSMHAAGIVHGNLTAHSVLVDDDGSVHICDVESPVRSWGYTPPEILDGGVFTGAGDMWSFGVLCVVMITGSVPFTHIGTDGAVDADASTALARSGELAMETTSDIYQLIRSLVVVRPTERMRADAALSHVAFNGLTHEATEAYSTLAVASVDPGCAEICVQVAEPMLFT
jgi:serine/threonine protein kinase